MNKSFFFKITINLALTIYSIVLFWGLYIGSHSRQHLNEFEYNLYPCKTIFSYIIEYNSSNKGPFIINIIGNIVVFFPFGFLLPIAFPKQLNRLDKLFFASLFGIILIELVQFALKLGVFDIDDIILNSIGLLVGFIILKLLE